MALHKPCGCGPLVPSPALTPPSKTPMSTVIHILRPPLKPIFRNSAVKPPRATAATPHKYVYPDPIPQFAESETQKFRAELSRRLSKEKETFGHDLHSVVDVCAEIFSEFLHREYGGPGTLLVEPFTDMLVALKEKELPGAPLAARTSLCYGLKATSIETGKFGTRKHRNDVSFL